MKIKEGYIGIINVGTQRGKEIINEGITGKYITINNPYNPTVTLIKGKEVNITTLALEGQEKWGNKTVLSINKKIEDKEEITYIVDKTWYSLISNYFNKNRLHATWSDLAYEVEEMKIVEE